MTSEDDQGYKNTLSIVRILLLNRVQGKHARVLRTLIIFTLVIAVFSGGANAAIDRDALRCNSGTSIGTDTTDSACGSSYSSFRTGLLLDPSGTTSSTIQFSSFSGQQMYAFFVNNSAYSTDTTVTGINGSISMDHGSGYSGTVYGKLELGYYDPGGAPDNFVNLFNSTETTGVSSNTQNSYSVSFNSASGIIPAGKKLAIRVWMRTTSSISPRFYTYRTTSGYDSSIRVDIATSIVSSYNISGYVTNKTSGSPLSGAVVQTNTSISTTTDVTGYYNFGNLSNGTYTISATLSGYATNSTTATINGANVSNANIPLSPLPPGQTYQATGRILVASNRYVVLDDPNTGSFSGTGFKNPSNNWGTNYFLGNETTITMWAMVLDQNGMPVPNTNVNFTLKNPIGTTDYTLTQSTDSNGLANVTHDMNGANYYGNWQIVVNATAFGLNDSTSFIYNWWGCGGGAGCGGHGSQSLTSGAPINSPYMSGHDAVVGRDGAHQSSNVCMYCHLSYNGQGSTPSMNTSDVHKNLSCDNPSCHGSISQHTTNMVIGSCSNCHNRTDLSKKTTLNGIVSNYSTTSDYHDTNSTIPCIICHGPMHNVTKPDESQRFIKNNITEDSQCMTCHQNYNKHNTSVNCTLCHSDDVHAIQVFSQSAGYVNHGSPNQGNCTNCHQNATFLNALKAQPKAGNYTGRNPPQIPVPLNHSIDPLNGSLWDGAQPGYWVNTSQSSACYYCHGKSLHNSSALGNINMIKGTNSLNQSLTGSTWCANCHYGNAPNYTGNLFNPQPPEVLNKSGLVPSTSSDGTPFYNHSGALSLSYDDATCKSCHNNNLAAGATSLNMSHNVGIGSAGGRDCVSCHDKGKSVEKVDVSKMNQSDSIHNFLNNNSIIVTPGLNPDNKRCWACHTNSSISTDNVVNEAELPASGHPDSYNVPKKCTQCHIQGNFSALVVSEHFSGSIGIRTKSYANTNDSCVNCHNKSEMLLSNSDPNGPKSIYASVSHYGSNKTNVVPYISGSSANCSYCHQNAANAFTTEMNDAAGNSSISNHTQLGTNPACINCHNSGRIHFASLTKPAVSSTLCANCHINKDQHNGSVQCSQCHMQSNRSIHPIQYLQPDATFMVNSPANKSTAVNCIDCHQGTGMSGFNNAPIIPDPLKHSANISNGTIWGTYWTSEQGSCYYCHGNTKHNNTALGQIKNLTLDSNNTKNGALQTTTWCADCHYSDAANTNYLGSLWSTAPPTITVDNTGKSGWRNHSTYLSGGYKDSNCQTCHALNGTYPSTSLNYSHSLNEGVAGGANCVGCHNVGGIAGPGRLVNVSAMNDNDAIHKNLNRDAVTSLPAENKKCWACHGDGNEPGRDHPANYKTPYRCVDCHVPSAGQNTNFTPNSILNVTQHYWNGTSIKTSAVASCYDCHNKSEMMLGQNLDPDGSASVYGGANGGSNSTSHYGKKRSDYPVQGTNEYCYQCHSNPSTAFPFIDDANKTIANHSTNYASSPNCADCHASQAGRIHNSTLYKPTFSLPNSTFCLNCHGTGGSATIKNKEQHNGTLDCTQCHLNSTRSIHPVRYLQQDGVNWDATKANAVNCTNCHQSRLPGFSSAPIIPDPLKHSASLSNGTIWGTYWISEQDSCYYCHGNTKHNNAALGSINNLTLDSNNTKNGALQTTTWCADCHYSDAANTNYLGSQWSPAPPTITVNNSGKSGWENHTSYVASGYKDEKCRSCHALNGAYGTTSLNFSHSLNVGVSGGADCISCHYVGSPYHNIDTIAANASVHFGMNSNNATSAGLAAIDGACWACHDTDGNVTNNPSNQVMGDIYNTPKKCDDCHLASGTYYSQASGWGAPTVSEHYYNASQIKAGNSGSNIASCINCHENVSEMVLSNNDPDYGSFAGDGVRLTGGNMSFYHYGKPRSDLRTWDSGQAENCSYCHQNTSTAFAAGMLNSAYNSSIKNHSQTQASPGCYNSTCHNSGWIHNNTLTKPSLNPGSTATFCQNCHTTKQTHNGTLDCSNCHINQSSGDTIHPIKFIQNTGTFDTGRVQAANCTSCHQGTGVNGFVGAPKVPEPVNHSTALSAGQKWGNYWDNTSQITACYYCHQNEIHKNNTVLFGNVSVIEGSNTFNNPDLANSTWCANCHYAGALDYKGNLLSVVPPEITNSSLVASDGTIFFNHSGLTNFNDSNCKNCHGRALSGYSETSLNLSHSVSEGGGDNCIDCHGTNYIGASPSVARTFVNISAFNESIHQNLNMTPPDTVSNLDCWSCHYNKDMNRQNVKKCGDCHRKPSQWHGNANITTNLSEIW